jgi:hypothetical protein
VKDQPAADYASRVELAKTLGKVRPDKGRYMIDIWAEGQRYRLRHSPVLGGECGARQDRQAQDDAPD